MGDMVWDTADTMVDTDMVVTTWARGLLMPNLRPHPKLMLMLPLPTMVDTMVDTDTTTARGLLMPNLRLMLMPLLMPTTDTMVVDTDTELMALDTDMVDTVDTMAVDTDTVADTDTTVKLLLKQQIFKAIFPHL